MKPRLSPRLKDILWHAGKAGVCLLNLWLATNAALSSTDSLVWAVLTTYLTRVISGVLIVVPCALFVCIWLYYDSVDDRSFNRLCNADDPTPFLRDPAYLVGLALSVAGATPILANAVLFSLNWGFAFLDHSLKLAISIGGSLLFVVVVSLWRVHRLYETWTIQKDLRTPQDKRPSVVNRVLLALVFFGATILAAALLVSWSLALETLARAAILLLTRAFLFVTILVVILLIIGRIRRVFERRRFLTRLERLQREKALTYRIHGHPYASLFFRHAHFSLTIIDKPHPDSPKKGNTTYQVAVADCRRRRMCVILCDREIIQILQSLNLRIISFFPVPGHNNIYKIPIASWYRHFTFAFPQGEGERVLLVDPAPVGLYLRGNRPNELISLDNDSSVFGYRVYGKNSFVNLLERI